MEEIDENDIDSAGEELLGAIDSDKIVAKVDVDDFCSEYEVEVADWLKNHGYTVEEIE